MSRGGTRLRRMVRLLRRIVLAVAGVVVGVAVLVALVLALPSARGVLLRRALDAAAGAAPGRLSVGAAAWPSPGRLELRGVVWRGAAADTVATVPRLTCVLDLGALLRRDLVVDSLLVRAARVDVPAAQALLAGLPPDTAAPVAAPDTAAARVPYLRTGARPGLPSAALGHLSVDVDTLRAAPGLRLAGVRLRGALEARHDRPALEARVEGSLGARGDALPAGRWSAVVAPDASGPRRLRVGWDARVTAPPAGPVDATAALDVDLDDGDEHLRLRARASLPPADPAALTAHLDTLALRLEGLRLEAHGALDTAQVRLAAVVEADASRLATGLLPDALAARRGDGSVRIDLAAPRPDLASAPATWTLAGLRVRATGSLAAPRIDLPPSPWSGWPAAGPRSVAARFDLTADGGDGGGVAGRADLDVSARDGAERVRLDATGRWNPADPAATTVAVDTLRLSMPHLDVRARGGVDPQGVRLTAYVAADGPALAPALTAAGADAPDARAELDLELTAPTPAWDAPPATWSAAGARLRLRGRGELPLAAWPQATWQDALPGWSERRARGRLEATAEGAADGRVHAALTAALDLPPAHEGAGDSLRVRVHADADPRAPALARVRLDTLVADLPGVRLRAQGAAADSSIDLTAALAVATPLPALAALVPQLVDVDAAADLRLEVTGTRRRPQARLEATARYRDARQRLEDLRVAAAGTRDSLALRLASGVVARDGVTWADSIDASAAYRPARALPVSASLAAARGADRIALGAAAGTDSLVTLRLDSLALVLAGQRLRLDAPVVARLDTAGHGYRMDPLVLAGEPGRLELGGRAHVDTLDLHAAIDLEVTPAMLAGLRDFGVPDVAAGLRLAGELDLDGTVRQPNPAGTLRVAAAPRGRRPALALATRFGLDAAGEPEAALELAVADTVRFRGDARWDGRLEEGVSPWAPVPVGDVVVHVPEQTLRLGVVAPYLPADLGLAGALDLGAEARLPVGREDGGSLAARLASRQLDVSLPNRSRLRLALDTRLEGSPRAPKVTGDVTVERGFLRIPELPRGLLPVEGSAELWNVAGAAPAAADSATSPAATWAPAAPVAAPARPLPDMDVRVRLPGQLHVNGYGLDVELGGDLRITRGVDAKGRPGPSVHGDVETLRGDLRFMNRSFTIRRGRVVFGGEVPPNPTLDLELDTDVAGNRIIINVAGRADDPEVLLTSQPERDEADIVGLLLFGRPLNDLDTDQRGRVRQEENPGQQLQQNLAGLALAFGTQDVQNSVTSTFGVDLVEFGTDSSGGGTVAAGRYLNPRLLLKYHQSLEKSGTYFMTLEYSLNRALRLISTYGQGEEASGLELTWQRRY